ncbi:MAG TPA: hypothetical protein VEB21_01460, partial [Terriglobales bacterium]|nr:hypothetical protein [Terriglobales bacterium]
ERNLWGLLHEGYTHGYHAPFLRAQHAEMLSLPDRRAQLKRALRRVAASDPPPDGGWAERVCARVFSLGKAIGELHGLLTLDRRLRG